jgi:hypothetical protein
LLRVPAKGLTTFCETPSNRGNAGTLGPWIFRHAAHWRKHSLFADSVYDSAETFSISLPNFFMGFFTTGPQSPDQTAAPNITGTPLFRLMDETLSVSVYSKELQPGYDYIFIVPERSYTNSQGQLPTTTVLHSEDLLPMASLLWQCHSRLRIKSSQAKQE